VDEFEDKRLLKAQKHLRNREFDAALELIKRVIKEDEANPDAWFLQGNVQKAQNKLQDAQRSFDRGLATDLNNEKLWLSKADVLISLNRIDEAKRSLDRALKNEPDYAEANITKGRLLQRTREFESALECFENILKVQPDNAEGWIGKGNTLFMGFSDPKGGLESLTRAIEIDRHNPEAWMNLGVIHRSMKDFEKAIGAFNEVIKIHPENKEALRYRDFCIRNATGKKDIEELKNLSYIGNWDTVEIIDDDEAISNWDNANEADMDEADEEADDEEKKDEVSNWDDVDEADEEDDDEEADDINSVLSGPSSQEELEEEEEKPSKKPKLSSIIKNINLSMFERIHSPCINIQIRVDLYCSNFITAFLEK